MNKILNKNLFLILFLILTACAYEPIFSNKDYGFQLDKINYVGSRDINRNIKNKLNLINTSDNNSDKKFNLFINSEKERKIISKDSKGDPSKFELVLNVFLEISNDKKKLLKRDINKSYIYNSETDKFKLEQNEEIIILNLSEKISEVIITLIMNLDDSQNF